MKLLFFVALFCCVHLEVLQAQDPEDKKTTTTITYSRTTREAEDHDKYNALRIDPIAVLIGEIPLYYERRLTNKLSVEAMVGITHSDYAYSIFNLEFVGNTGDRESKFGYMFGGAIKFYPSSESFVFEGPFFGLDFRYKVYLTDLINTCSPSSPSESFPERRSVFDAKLFGGYNWLLSESISVELYAGVGVRSQVIDGYICTGGNSPVTTFAKYDDSTERLAFSFGAKIGFLF